MEISAKLKDAKEATKVNYNFPSDLKGLTEKFGAEVVFAKAMDSLVIDVQALVRRHLVTKTDKDGKVISKPKSAAEIQAIVAAWIPGVGSVRKTPVEKIGSLLSQMTPEEKKALLAQLTAKA
jgi:hypothetical protein